MEPSDDSNDIRIDELPSNADKQSVVVWLEVVPFLSGLLLVRTTSNDKKQTIQKQTWSRYAARHPQCRDSRNKNCSFLNEEYWALH